MLGTFHCQYDCQPLKNLPQGRQQILFAYLLLHEDTPINRKSLAFRFWPDSSEQQALNNLRKLIHGLKRLLPASEMHLATEDRHIVWKSHGTCHVDVLEFERFGKSHLQQELEQAIAYYKGQLLPGYYDDWVVERRETLLTQYRSVLERMIVLRENNRDYGGALLHAIRLLQTDPLSEQAHLRLARLHFMQGDSAAALKQYEDMKKRLHEELDIVPSAKIDAAFKDLLACTDVLVPHSPDRQQTPLIGRNREWEVLLQSWDRALREKSISVILEGEAGIGKTRLAEEFAWWAKCQNIRVLTANGYPSGLSLSYETISVWLEQVKWNHLDLDTLSEISRVLPAIRERHPELTSPNPLYESWQLRRWYQTIERTLLNGEPANLILNDLQWADKESLEMLNYFLRSERSTPLLLICTLRSRTMDREIEMQNFIEFQRSARKLVHLSIPSLTEMESHLLIQNLRDSDTFALDTKQIHEVSGGNPLFMQEIVRAAQTGCRHEDFDLTVVNLMMQRLADLPQTSQSLINVMSILDKPAPLSFLAEFADTPEHAAEQSDLMLQLRIFKLTDNGWLDFFHERMRTAAQFRLSSLKKLLMHGKVAEAMTRHANLHFFTPTEIAHHFEQAGMGQEAVPYLIQAARDAYQIFAHDRVVHYSQKAIPSANPEQQLEIFSLLAQAYRMLGQWKEAENAYRTWLEKSDYTVPLQEKALHEVGLGNCLRLQGRYHEALSHFETSLRIFSTMEHREGMADAYGNRGIIRQYMGDYDTAEKDLQKSIELSANGHEREKFLGVLGNVYYEQGQYPQAIQTYKMQLRIANDQHNPIAIAKALGGMGMTHLEMHEFDAAYHSFHEKLQLSRSLGDRMGTAISVGLIGKYYSKAGYHDEACSSYLFVLREALNIGDVRVLAIILGLLGHSLDELGSDTDAIWTMEQSERIASSIHAPFFVCDALYFKSFFLVKRFRWKEAEACIQNALKLAAEQNRKGLGRMLNVLLIRSHVAAGMSTEEASLRLNSLSEQNIEPNESFHIHAALWELCGNQASRDQAFSTLSALYRKSTVPLYMKWASLLNSDLSGPPKTAAAVPDEVIRHSVSLEELKSEIAAIRT